MKRSPSPNKRVNRGSTPAQLSTLLQGGLDPEAPLSLPGLACTALRTPRLRNTYREQSSLTLDPARPCPLGFHTAGWSTAAAEILTIQGARWAHSWLRPNSVSARSLTIKLILPPFEK